MYEHAHWKSHLQFYPGLVPTMVTTIILTFKLVTCSIVKRSIFSNSDAISSIFTVSNNAAQLGTTIFSQRPLSCRPRWDSLLLDLSILLAAAVAADVDGGGDMTCSMVVCLGESHLPVTRRVCNTRFLGESAAAVAEVVASGACWSVAGRTGVAGVESSPDGE